MKITVDDQLFDIIPGLCIGVVALRAADNRDVNLEAEAFRRRCCTEANLLLKMNPHIADQEIERYQKVLEKLSIASESGLAKTFAEYKKDLGLFEQEEAKETSMEILPAPKTATLDELAGSDVLPRRNPILDMVRAGMLKFHVDIHAYDMGDRSRTLSIRKTEDDVTVSLGDDLCTTGWLAEDQKAGQITPATEDVLILITGFAPNRKKVAAARNELARRVKSAFDRAVEVGWIEEAPHTFETDI